MVGRWDRGWSFLADHALFVEDVAVCGLWPWSEVGIQARSGEERSEARLEVRRGAK